MAIRDEAPGLATAHEAWDKEWATEKGRAAWLVPHPDVVGVAERLRASGCRTALDLGCGVGRHAVSLARGGFEVHALDGSETALAHLKESARAQSLAVEARLGVVSRLPYADAQFDFVLSWNVIYHGHAGEVATAIAEIWRVLKPGGLFQGTMLSKRHELYGKGREIRPDTFIVDDAIEESGDKAHAHYYCDAAELIAMFRGFEILSVVQDEQGKPGEWHWHLLAERSSTR